MGKGIPPPPDISTNRGIDIVPECRSKGTFVARFNRNPVNRFGAVRRLHGPLKRAFFGQQRGKLCFCTTQIALRCVALCNVRAALIFDFGKNFGCRFNRRLQFNHALRSVFAHRLQLSLVAHRRKLVRQPRHIACRPVSTPLRICRCCVCHPQFRLGPCLFCKRFGKRHLAFSRLAFGGIARAGKRRAFILNRLDLRRQCGAFRLQPRQRIGGVVRQLAFTRSVVGHPRGLC